MATMWTAARAAEGRLGVRPVDFRVIREDTPGTFGPIAVVVIRCERPEYGGDEDAMPSIALGLDAARMLAADLLAATEGLTVDRSTLRRG